MKTQRDQLIVDTNLRAGKPGSVYYANGDAFKVDYTGRIYRAEFNGDGSFKTWRDTGAYEVTQH